ncbi:MAG: LamG-like jellyroll fold domain-containing protein [Bacteroidia bacterium]
MSSRGEHANVQSSAVGAGAGTLIRNGCGSVNTTDTVGNPSVFGNFSWNVYAWNSTGSDSWNVNYAGYYVDTAMSMNTLNYWADDLSPSYAAGYSGLPVTEDDHSFAARRRGFPTGYYRINVAAHDDDALLFINGIEVWEHIGCCDNHDDVWEGYLSDTSEIDFRVLEYGGGSYGVLDVIPVPLAGMAVSTFVPCHGGNSVLTITAEGGFPPYTGTGSFFVPQGDYQYTIYDSLGDSAIVDVHIPGPAAPDTVIATSIANAFCDGDTVTLTAPSYGKTASFDGNAGRILIPFDSPETDYTYELDFKTTEGYVGLSSVRDGDLSGSFDRDLYLEEGEIRHRLYSEETIGSTGHYYADGLWHHVAVVVESGVGQRIYVDGDEVANGGMDHSDFNWDNTINIGFAGNFMNGEIDNIRLWNVVRTPSEIIQDQNLHVVGWQQGLIGNWDFDESDGLNVINTVDNSESEFVNGPTVAEHNSNTYLWNNGSSSQSITITDGGTYTVQITNVNGCPMNDLSLDLTRHAMPAAPTINANSSLSFCSGNEVTLMTPDTGSIQWKKNGEDIEHENSEQLTVSEEGNYSVTITSSFGCATTSSEQFVEVFRRLRCHQSPQQALQDFVRAIASIWMHTLTM